ncbi:5259_t:CDS:2, partial [Diversispora eburnea]
VARIQGKEFVEIVGTYVRGTKATEGVDLRQLKKTLGHVKCTILEQQQH